MRMNRTLIAHLAGSPLAALVDHLAATAEVCRAGEEYPKRALGSWFIQRTVSGQARAMADGEELHHRPGSLLVLAPGVRLAETVLERWELRYLTLNGPWPELLRPILAGRRALLLPAPPRAWVAALDGCVDELHAGKIGWPWRAAGELAVLLGGLLSLPAAADGGDLLERVGRLVQADPARCWDVPAIARALRLPTRTLQARFRHLAPEGVARWVLARRLEHARLLLDRGLPVATVADRLGFANPYHFSRVCRRVLGAPPRELRRG